MDNLAFQHTGIRGLGFGVESISRQLAEIGPDRQKLPFAAFGLFGEPARLVYEHGAGTIDDKIVKATQSSRRVASKMDDSAGSYKGAEDGALDVIPNMDWEDAETESPPDAPGLGDIKLPEMFFYISDLGAVSMGGMSLMGRAESLAGREAYLRVTGQYSKLARVESLSRRTYALLEVAGAATYTALAGLVLWGGSLCWHEDQIDEAIYDADRRAAALNVVLGDQVAAYVRELARVWAGAAHGAADGKLRDFITAGVHLADAAAEKAAGLRDVVKRLNLLHAAAFYAAATETAFLVALAALARFMPQARVTCALIGRRLTTTLLQIQGAIAGVMSTWAAADAARGTPIRFGLGEPDFPFV